MPTIETLRELADLAAEVARLPDEANVGWATAALLINIEDPPSQRTLERWRQARNKLGENGPPYIPGPGLTSPVAYNVGSVRKWVRDRQAATTMQVSSRRGLTFAAVADLSRLEPWVMRDGLVVGHALTASADALDGALRGADGATLHVDGLADVLKDVVWSDPVVCRSFHDLFAAVLKQAQAEAHSVLLASSLHHELPGPSAASRDRCPRCG